MSEIEKRAREILGKFAGPAQLSDYGYDQDDTIYFEGDVLELLIAALTPPEGYVLVPLEPTEAMKDAFQGFRPVQRTSFACRYEEMLAARPEVNS